MQLNRYSAASIHLVVSLSIVGLLAYMAVYVWYPDFYFNANGAWFPMSMVLMVDAMLGPAMTLILYRPGKPGLKFDLTLILLIQIAAFTYGASTLYFQRPALLVHYNSLIVCLNPTQVIQANAKLDELSANTHPFPFVHLPLPTVQQKHEWNQRMKNLSLDNVHMPAYVFGELFQPVDTNSLPNILKEELDLSHAIKMNDQSQAAWNAFVHKHGDKTKEYAYYTMGCSNDEYVAAVDRKQGYIIDAFRMNTLNARKKRLVQPSAGLPKINWLEME